MPEQKKFESVQLLYTFPHRILDVDQNEIYLSFDTDLQCAAFRDWWSARGSKQFQDWIDTYCPNANVK